MPCVPLSCIFQVTNVTHINFAIIDVEGGEISVLQSIDFGSVRFDVLIVETKSMNGDRSEAIIELVAAKAGGVYNAHERQKGRNTWFVHRDFKGRQRTEN